jgi:hypothetical protein
MRRKFAVSSYTLQEFARQIAAALEGFAHQAPPTDMLHVGSDHAAIMAAIKAATMAAIMEANMAAIMAAIISTTEWHQWLQFWQQSLQQLWQQSSKQFWQ